MKKGDLYYLWNIPSIKVLITKVFNKRKFHDNDSRSNPFPSMSIVRCVKTVVVSGKHKGEKAIHAIEDFKTYYRKIEVEDEKR